MKNLHYLILYIAGGILILTGLSLIAGLFNSAISSFIAQTVSRQANQNWPGYYSIFGWLCIIIGLALIAARHLRASLVRIVNSLRSAISSLEARLTAKLSNQVDFNADPGLGWPLIFNRLDWAVILFFILLAVIYQLAMSAHGFPTVILGGDAANIASFAAGRAYPNLFQSDAILGDLRNIGLYVTIHLPVTIALEKLLGNFGLAYSLLLFPHVFMQYFAYYLLGRVIFKDRYWSFLFSLAVSAPLNLAGGEIWGAVGDAMPRFTFQVLIPFILILLLTIWRDRPQRWSWIMVVAGLLAFVHPVSTPTWAFALWLGLWPCMPPAFSVRQKLLEMFKQGLILTAALLPYISIYLYFHKSGRLSSDYDLVYLILTNYFPYDLLNIPSAVRTLISATSQYGLLWFGLAGLALTFFLFRSERSRLKQMIMWMAGITFVTILIPYVEQSIERALRIIPLQTELMRGMRYLVPFLFIFWFYPLAELTRRAYRGWLVRIVFVIGTLMTLSWIILDPPYPIVETPHVVACWSQGHLICPYDTDYADALAHIRNDTPLNSKFVVFLTNRWSGIEVRYLGLRPMAYAYKDRGQLTFTNLEALQTWYYYLRRENAIYSRSVSPTLDLQQKRMIDFAFDTEANYVLTNFAFPPDVCKKLGITAVYRNNSYTILNIYKTRPQP